MAHWHLFAPPKARVGGWPKNVGRYSAPKVSHESPHNFWWQLAPTLGNLRSPPPHFPYNDFQKFSGAAPRTPKSYPVTTRASLRRRQGVAPPWIRNKTLNSVSPTRTDRKLGCQSLRCFSYVEPLTRRPRCCGTQVATTRATRLAESVRSREKISLVTR